jgi:hypothetical protein
MTEQVKAFVETVRTDLCKLSVFEHLGFEGGMIPTIDEVQRITARTVSVLRAQCTEISDAEVLIALVKEAEQGALQELARKAERQAQAASEDFMPPASGWSPQGAQSNKRLILAIAGALCCIALALLIGSYRASVLPRPSRPLRYEQTTLDGKLASPGDNAQTNPILGRPNPYNTLPKMNTPQQAVNDLAEGVVAAGGDLIKEGIEEGSELHYSGRDPSLNLLWQARRGDVDKMEYWLEKGADANIQDPHKNGDLETPLMCAVRSGNPDAVELLLSKISARSKRSVNRENATALTIARSLRNNASTLKQGKRFSEIERALEHRN